ncbi:actin-binding protein IPP isoform X1 [Varanus komodoensis]|uniref:Intracisternal A particle-promoted polypeptide n=1 Tax=Varanus komodoensis TaxID=61221 RepID=A0A8D2JEU3_VARKO|nr:actin-binding protein IPP isoform X1 [Varanus komodoensis]XP_044297660.1 actin-binding protein IPP isoform X1 [Varanus komodoensis]XP_044297669.1 actin-binding protein IPP isoform X1 [Varanus komodoensis]
MACVTSPSTSEFSFMADRHARLVLAQINKMRCGQHFCDVQLQVGEEVFKVHRLVLAASSPYFVALFTGGMQESSKDVVRILGVDADIFQILLDFIYTGIVSIGESNVQELIVAADMFQLTEVVDLCCEFLKGQIDPMNCIGLFQFSEQIACHDLLDFTENYIHAHFLDIQNGEEFLALTKDQLIKILRSEELSIEDEYQVFTAAMQWILKDLGRRKKYVVEILDTVRFPLLPPQRLLKYIEGVPDFSLRVALQTLLKEYCEVCKSPKESKVSSFLQAAKARPRRKARKYLYAVGGYTRLQGGRWSDSRALSCVERFDTFSQYWTTVSSLHQARSGLGVAVVGGMVYAIGGEKDSMIFDCTERYDPITKQWATVASMNHPRCGLGVCACYGTIYAFGGWVGAEIGSSIERFDPEENSWEVVGSMAVPRYNFGCCEMQGLIYVVGGIGNEGIELCSAEEYNPISKRWSVLPEMGTRRAYLGVAALDDCIYAVGGWNENQDALPTVEKYSFEEEKWVEVASMKAPRAGVCVVAVNGLLYATGGRTASYDSAAPVTSDSVEVYNPHTDTWTEIANMITSRCEGGIAVL